jgi:DNA-binding phage protein
VLAVSAEAVERIRIAAQNLEKWHAERDAAVRAAAAADVSRTEIARVSGLSRAHVYRLLED